MGYSVTATIHQDENVVFDDLGVLNAELMSDPGDGLGELYGDHGLGESGWRGPVAQDAGRTKLATRSDGGFEGYGDWTEVWSCWSDGVSRTIASHIVAGKLVIAIREEDDDPVYHVLTPGSMEKAAAGKVLF